jgi:uncharacterized protein (DUF2252 family)
MAGTHVEELRTAGRERRQVVPRSTHARFDPQDRTSDPLDILAEQDRVRVPELVPIRYGRMSVSPFTFFRGQAAVMAADLATTPTTSIETQLCGDAHLSNFGTYGTPERRLVFDLNDFDETLPGPFEWDLKRLAASFVLAARDRGFRTDVGEEAVLTTVETYRTVMEELAEADVMDVWYAGVSDDEMLAALDAQAAADQLDASVAARTRKLLERSRRRTSAQAAAKLTEAVDGQVRFREDPPILSSAALPADRIELTRSSMHRYLDSLPGYRRQLLARFEVVDATRRVVGVGSVGTRAYLVLLRGRDTDDLLILQVKEALPSVLERHLGPATQATSGHRVVEGQHTMQTASDMFLGWLTMAGPDGVERDFYVRQFRDMKGGVDLERVRPIGLVAYARLCGRLLANAHARGGQPAQIAGYLGSGGRFAEAMVEFATTYADLSELDHQRLLEAIAAGRVAAERGV